MKAKLGKTIDDLPILRFTDDEGTYIIGLIFSKWDEGAWFACDLDRREVLARRMADAMKHVEVDEDFLP